MKAASHSSQRKIAIWLFICCGMIFVMALLGAITRLTGSGLSITDWAPVTGAIPPLNDADWHKTFLDYQKLPQYQQLNRGMTLHEFKGIYFWEWLHRLWGRLIGIVLIVPLIYFFLRRKISKLLGIKLVGIFLLGGLQGFIGWFMVTSGFANRTSVSPYRLALHLGFALLIYALLFWIALGLINMRTHKLKISASLLQHGWIALALLVLTMIWGAFTAGLHAGLAYNTWPLMEGEFFPSAALTILPKWHNAFENLAFVQFIHRWLAPLTAAVLLLWSYRLWRRSGSETDRNWALALAMMGLLQIGLGISTILTHANLMIATVHQAGAITLLTLLLINLKRALAARGGA